MTVPRGLAKSAPGCLCLVAIALMGWASFLPYVSIPAWWNDGLSVGPYSISLASWSLADGHDALLVVVFLGALSVGAVASLARTRHLLSATVSLIASVGLVVLALYESSGGGRHVLPAWVLPGSGGEAAPVEPVTVGVGYTLFLTGAVLAAIASLTMVVRLWVGKPPTRGKSVETEIDAPEAGSAAVGA